jgi:hypothetical protein
MVKDAFVLQSLLPITELKKLQQLSLNLYLNNPNYNIGFGRHQWTNLPELFELQNLLVELAREEFCSETLVPAWNMLVAYEGIDAKLQKHKDDNACTYHIDLSIFQKQPWGIVVEDTEYILQENDALFLYGNDQEHWRNEFPNPDNNLVINALLFFVEPDHWLFTKGPEYIDTIRSYSKD